MLNPPGPDSDSAGGKAHAQIGAGAAGAGSGQYLFDVLVDAGAEFGLEIAGCVTFSG